MSYAVQSREFEEDQWQFVDTYLAYSLKPTPMALSVAQDVFAECEYYAQLVKLNHDDTIMYVVEEK